MIASLMGIGKIQTHSTVFSYNCDKQEKIERLNKQFVCQGDHKIKPLATITYDLLQKPLVHHTKGFGCQQNKHVI